MERKFRIMKLIASILVIVLVILPMSTLAAEADQSALTLEDSNSVTDNSASDDLQSVEGSNAEDERGDEAAAVEADYDTDVTTLGGENTISTYAGSVNVSEPIEYQICINGKWSIQTTSAGWGVGSGGPVEAIKMSYANADYNAQLEYRTYVSNYGWQEWKQGGMVAGATQQGQFIEAIQIRFKEGSELSSQFDFYYYVESVSFGRLGYASNGEIAGTTGMTEKLGGMYFEIIAKDSEHAPAKNGHSYIQGYEQTALSYSGHVQDKGDVTAVTGGKTLGTVGQSKRIEGVKVSLNTAGEDVLSGGITYRTYVQNKGWLAWKNDGAFAGTIKESLRVEAMEIKLTGEAAKYYSVYYRLHVQDVGWMGWSADGATAGTTDMSRRVEAVQIVLVAKGADHSTYKGGAKSYIRGYRAANLIYSGHVQNIGDVSSVNDGQTMGTAGKSLRVEGLRISLDTSGSEILSGGITYNVHIQDVGWQGWKSNGAYAGTTGRSLRLEAIQIKLTGEAAIYYDVYYRAHVQNYGWMGWAKNGQSAGTSKHSYRMEAIQIKLVAKTEGPPGSTANAYREGKQGWYYEGGYKFYYKDGKKLEDIRSIIGKQSSYVIMVNKQQSCITVYAKDGNNGYIIPVVSFACSPGTATPTGTFYTPEKYRWKALMGGVWGQYSTRITGGILFHSVPYKSQNIYTLKSDQYNKLGTWASAGCIRMRVIDAKWIYDNCSLKTKVVIYNSSVAGPFTKPSYAKIPLSQNWDPTDPAVK